MPVIAIAPCGKLPDYETSISRAGGIVRILSRTADSPVDVVASVDGIVLTGGGDVLPSRYGALAHPLSDPAEAGRDEYELELVHRAHEADIPLLAICRGLQVLNVAFGGTLIQDIPDERGTAVNHRIATPPYAIAHEIQIEPGSMLERLIDGSGPAGHACTVNSRHHQAPGTVGNGLVVTATAPDGIIEALEDPRRRFCVGVQWHPENFWRTGEFHRLFEGFVKACGI